MENERLQMYNTAGAHFDCHSIWKKLPVADPAGNYESKSLLYSELLLPNLRVRFVKLLSLEFPTFFQLFTMLFQFFNNFRMLT